MKIKFHKGDEPQDPVMPSQTQMRRAKSPKHPVLKFVIIAALVVGAAYAMYRIYTHDKIYSYGIVTGKKNIIHAPGVSEITGLNVKQGDTVKKGDVLFMLASKEEMSNLNATEALLNKYKLQLKAFEEKGILPTVIGPDGTFGTKLSRLNFLRQQIQQIHDSLKEKNEKISYATQYAEIEVKKLTDFYEHKKARFEKIQKMEETTPSEILVAENEAEISRLNFGKTIIEIKKLEYFYAGKKKRYEQIEQLFKMDGATAQDVESTKSEMELAEKNLEMAKIEMQKSEAVYNLRKDTAENMKKAVARTTEHSEKIADSKNEMLLALRNLEQAKLDLEHAKKKSDIELNSLELQRSTLEMQIKNEEDFQKNLLTAEGKKAESNTEVELLRIEIKRMESEVEKLKAVVGPTKYTAPFDGVISELKVSEGQSVPKSEVVMIITSIEDTWIEAYVPVDKSRLLEIGKEATIYSEQQSGKIKGEIASKAAAVMEIPPALKNKLHPLMNAVFINIKINEKNNLFPGSVVRVVVQ